MSTRKTTFFYAVLIAIASLAVGMVIASRLDLTPASSAQMVAIPAMNSTPVGGPLDSTTFRNIAKSQIPTVVNIRTESRQRTQDLTEVNVVDLQPGDPVTVTFDAIPDLTMPGKVARVRPMGENRQGDIVYSVVIEPDRQDPRLRWNMTASVAIHPD